MACQSVLEKKNGPYTTCQSTNSMQNSCSPIVSANPNRQQAICSQIKVAEGNSEVKVSNSAGPPLSSATTCAGRSQLDYVPIGGSVIDSNSSELPLSRLQSQPQLRDTCQHPHSVYNDHSRQPFSNITNQQGKFFGQPPNNSFNSRGLIDPRFEQGYSDHALVNQTCINRPPVNNGMSREITTHVRQLNRRERTSEMTCLGNSAQENVPKGNYSKEYSNRAQLTENNSENIPWHDCTVSDFSENRKSNQVEPKARSPEQTLTENTRVNEFSCGGNCPESGLLESTCTRVIGVALGNNSPERKLPEAMKHSRCENSGGTPSQTLLVNSEENKLSETGRGLMPSGFKSTTGSQLAEASLQSPLSGAEEASVNSASVNGALNGMKSVERGLPNDPALLPSSLGEVNLRNNQSFAGSSVPCPGLGKIASENLLHCAAPARLGDSSGRPCLGNKPSHDTSLIQQPCNDSLLLDNMHLSPKNLRKSLEGKFRGTEGPCIEVADFVSQRQISRSTRSIAIASSLPNNSPIANHSPRASNPGMNRTNSTGQRGSGNVLSSPGACTREPDKQNNIEPRGSENDLSSPGACTREPDKQNSTEPRGSENDLSSPGACTREPDKQNSTEPKGPENDLSSPGACTREPDKQNSTEPKGPENDLSSPGACTREPDKQNSTEPKGPENDLSSPGACTREPDKQNSTEPKGPEIGLSNSITCTQGPDKQNSPGPRPMGGTSFSLEDFNQAQGLTALGHNFLNSSGCNEKANTQFHQGSGGLENTHSSLEAKAPDYTRPPGLTLNALGDKHLDTLGSSVTKHTPQYGPGVCTWEPTQTNSSVTHSPDLNIQNRLESSAINTDQSYTDRPSPTQSNHAYSLGVCVLEPTPTPSPVINSPDSNFQNSFGSYTLQAEQLPSSGSSPIPLKHVHCPGIHTLEPIQALSADSSVLKPKQSHTLVGQTIEINQPSSPGPQNLKYCYPSNTGGSKPEPLELYCKGSDALKINQAHYMRSNPRSNQPLDSPWDGTLELNGQISPEASVLEIQLRHNNCSQEVNPLEPRLAREPGRSIVESYGNAPENSLENELSGYQSENHPIKSSLTQPNYMAYETDPKMDLNNCLSRSAKGLDFDGSISECDSSSATGKVPNGTPEVDEQDVNNTVIVENAISYAISESSHYRYYVNGQIDACRGKFLIDTGSSISVVATKLLEKLNQKIDIEPTDRQVRTANGGFLNIKGTCSLTIRLDHLTFEQEFIIADIEESLGILGVNFLDQYRADMGIKKRILKTDQGKVKLHKRGAQACNKLQLCENVIIPAQSETLDKAYMPDSCLTQFSTRGPSNRYVSRGLPTTTTLLESTHNQMTMSVLNESNKNIKRRESPSLEAAQHVDQVSGFSEENECIQKPDGQTGNTKFPLRSEQSFENLSTELNSEERHIVINNVTEKNSSGEAKQDRSVPIRISPMLKSGEISHFSGHFYDCFVILACLIQLTKLTLSIVFTIWLLSCVSTHLMKNDVNFIQLTLCNPIIVIDSHLKYVIVASLLKSFVEGITITQCQGHIIRLWKREPDKFVSIITWIKLMNIYA